MSAVFRHGDAQAAELVVRQLQHTRQPAELSAVLRRQLHGTLVADVVLDSRPHMLQGCTHLNLEGHARKRAVVLQVADVVQRVVAEARQLVSLALVDRVRPVHLEVLLHNGRHLVHVVRIERNDADTHQVGDILQTMVLVALALQLADQRLLRLHAGLHTVQLHALRLQHLCQHPIDMLLELLQLRQPLMVLLYQHLPRRTQRQVHLNSKRLVKPVMAKTCFRSSFKPRINT